MTLSGGYSSGAKLKKVEFYPIGSTVWFNGAQCKVLSHSKNHVRLKSISTGAIIDKPKGIFL